MNTLVNAIRVSLAGMLLLLCGCDNGPDLEVEQSRIIEAVTTDLILPEYTELVTQTDLLKEAGQQFAETGSSGEYVALQQAWKATFVQWKKCQVFHFGPMVEENFHLMLDFSPTRDYLIDQAIWSGDSIDEAFVDGQGAAAKGFPGLEYLLFDAASGDQVTWDSLTIGVNADRRRQYVAAATSEISQIAASVLATWEGSYQEVFTSSTSGFHDELSEVANAMLYILEVVKNDRIGSPLGKDAGGQAAPTKAEAWRSEYSWPLLMANLTTAHQVYLGAQAYGFDDYLTSLGYSDLADQIDGLFQQVLADCAEAADPLSTSVYTERHLLEPIYEDLTTLIRLMKSDMFSFLSISVTFTDADGD